MSTPQRTFRERMLDPRNRRSTNIEDRRGADGIAPPDSAGYFGYSPAPLGGNVMPDLGQAVKLPVDRAHISDGRVNVDRARSEMAKMGPYAPLKRRKRATKFPQAR